MEVKTKLEFVKPNQTYVIDTEQTSPEKLYDLIHQDVYDYVEEFIGEQNKDYNDIDYNTSIAYDYAYIKYREVYPLDALKEIARSVAWTLAE